jgi:transposase-like protein
VFREFPFESKLFERYSRVEQALLMAIAESYIQGVSTRRMEDLVKSFGLNRLSASEVSRICAILDEKAEEFLKRPIETKIRYLLVDATYFKVRYGAQYKTRALLIVAGIREDGLREILGASIAKSKDSGYWLTLFRSLKKGALTASRWWYLMHIRGFKRQWNLHSLVLPGSTAMPISPGQYWREFPRRIKKRLPRSSKKHLIMR